jgi:hypothetical protein
MIPAPVDAVPAVQQKVGSLRDSAVPGPAARWETGLAWRPERCFTAQGYGPCETNPGVPTLDGAEAHPAYFYPVGFRVRDICIDIPGMLDSERIRRQAEATTSFQAARELATGALSSANPVTIGTDPPYVNPFLADGNATVITSTAATLELKLGALEEAAMAGALGQQVYLHIPASYVLAISQQLVQTGNVLYTRLGNVVVADAGYPGAGPSAPTDTDWVYATGPVVFRASDIVITDDPTWTINRKTNKQEIWADRMVAATYDPCTHYALKLGL